MASRVVSVNRRPRRRRALVLGALIGLARCGSQRSAEEATMTATVSDLTDTKRAAIDDSVEQAWSEMMAVPGLWIRRGYVPDTSRTNRRPQWADR